ncbi:hypothetical protein HNR62_003236 [Oceanisphaera litoralis]|uniref:DUF2513 domain-containing protein n=1 Tax=Oceanisphaera litoralis TaxID=225144 RepID=UPI00195A3427|nr:DUF2513 domain-containing protein [Oceanisphaera litoralis]MBM7457323.1 hypothetical protein [Oceanisphaera litoralis]
MRIDLDYVAQLLDVFLEADTAHISVPEIESSGIKIAGESGLDEKFLFHFQLAAENGLISNRDLQVNGLKSLGITIGAGGGVTLMSTPIRLTQAGHDFASALQNKEVLVRLRSELKDAPFRVLFEGSQKLLDHFLKKKLDQLLE